MHRLRQLWHLLRHGGETPTIARSRVVQAESEAATEASQPLIRAAERRIARLDRFLIEGSYFPDRNDRR